MRTHTLLHAEQAEDEARYHNSYILARVEEQVVPEQDVYNIDLPPEALVGRSETVEQEQSEFEFVQLPSA